MICTVNGSDPAIYYRIIRGAKRPLKYTELAAQEAKQEMGRDFYPATHIASTSLETSGAAKQTTTEKQPNRTGRDLD